MDGIDIAWLQTDGKDIVNRGKTGFFPYDASTRKLLNAALEDAHLITNREDRPGVLGDAEATVTRLHAEAVSSFIDEHGFQSEDINLLGFHGQTILHRPDQGVTVQLGDGQKLAAQTGIDTVFDLRANDMVHGGQGAPLVPIYHQALRKSLPEAMSTTGPVAFVNIGGIANITYVGDALIAFDTGPGNALIDQWVQQHVGVSHDQGGFVAAEGSIDDSLVAGYLEHPFLSKPVPKSLDRKDFIPPEPESGSVEDVARSLANLTARTIAMSAQHLPNLPSLWIICGGGRLNPHIMNDLNTLLSEAESNVITAEEAGFDGDFMEAEAWAYLAVRSQTGLPLTFPKTTGCKTPVSGGVLAHAGPEA